ncbi:unnamed protein product [Periconia digitata]|uniref:Uncharacterized protein n=1 Tax=Periconia digitata TaxID=1303443 RepID=A0A9W4XP97_9PLEO|nr:unnamed protein product [Periconia digitata]
MGVIGDVTRKRQIHVYLSSRKKQIPNTGVLEPCLKGDKRGQRRIATQSSNISAETSKECMVPVDCVMIEMIVMVGIVIGERKGYSGERGSGCVCI